MRVEPPSCGSAHLAATELWQCTLSRVDIASYPRIPRVGRQPKQRLLHHVSPESDTHTYARGAPGLAGMNEIAL